MNWSTTWPSRMAKTAGIDWTRKLAAIGRVLVHVDLGQGDRALGGVDHPLDDRAEGLARPAPGRPQVDHHRNLGRAAEDLLLEGGIGDVDHRHRRYREGRVRPVRPSVGQRSERSAG